jgi:tRNA(Ile)-lysidine synthase
VRVHRFNQRDFPFPPPAFQLLLPADRLQHVVVRLPVEQAVHIVFGGEALKRVLFVLKNALIQAAGDADVEGARQAAHDVNAVAAGLSIAGHVQIGILRSAQNAKSTEHSQTKAVTTVANKNRLNPKWNGYHGLVHLAQDVLAYIRKHALLKAGDRVGVAVSGGADSVALLRLLLELHSELGIILSVVHFNHQLRAADSDQDEEFVAQLARHHKLELHGGRGDVADFAAAKQLSLEAAARKMRYEFFCRLLREGGLNRIATGHTLDDQAETVLLRVARGAGSRGLAGIYPQLSVPGSQFSAIVRPLLATRRRDLEIYLAELGQTWREDGSNRDLRHSRNRVRHGILPRLERNLNPQVREALAETAEIARAEEDYWQREVARVLPSLWNAGTLDLSQLLALPLALRRRIVRAAAESLGLRLEFRHVEDILALETSPAKSAMLPGDWVVSRHKNDLRFAVADSLAAPSDYEYRLRVPGSVDIPQIRARLEAVLVSGNAAQGYNPEQLLDRFFLGDELIVRNWRPGDRFWPPHTKGPKKIKELLQERHLTGNQRKHWPVVASVTQVVWVSGFGVPAQLRLRNEAGTAVAIREIPLSGR